MDTMIELPAMRRSAELAPNTADADARTVEVIWSAGARVRRATFFGEPYDEELSLDPAHVRLDRLNAGAPFLKVHELDTLDAVIGSVVPGSARVRLQAMDEGLDRVFEDFGAEWRFAGCSMCLGMNPDQLKPGERSASTSNRNFEGRQGPGGRTHLVSPLVAAATAVTGHLSSPADL